MDNRISASLCAMNTGLIVLAVFIIAWGMVWLGNDIGWWKFHFPFWPIVVILTGCAILIHELKKK